MHRTRTVSLGACLTVLAVSVTAMGAPAWAQPNTPMTTEVTRPPGGFDLPAETIRMAAPTTQRALNFYWNTNGTGWNTRRVAAGPANSEPAIAIGGGATRIAVVGPQNHVDLYWNTNGSTSWSKSTIIRGSGTVVSAPAMTRGDGTSLIATRHSDNSLWFMFNRDTTSSWPATQVDGPGSILSSPGIAHSNGATGIATRGPNNSLNFYWNNDGSTTWNKVVVAASGATITAPAIDRAPSSFLIVGSTNIAVRTPTGGVDLYRNFHNDSNWFKHVVAGSGTAFSEPSIAYSDFDGNREYVVTVQGPNNSLLFFWKSSSGQWNQVQVDGPGTTWTAPSITKGVSSTSISTRDAAGNVVVYRNANGSSSWSKTVLPG